jgi:hypothetical protein
MPLASWRIKLFDSQWSFDLHGAVMAEVLDGRVDLTSARASTGHVDARSMLD